MGFGESSSTAGQRCRSDQNLGTATGLRSRGGKVGGKNVP